MSWIEKLEQKIRSEGVDSVPKGWMTTRQIADEMGLSSVRAGHIVRGQVRSGWMEKKNFRILVGDLVRPVPHYRPAEEAANNEQRKKRK